MISFKRRDLSDNSAEMLTLVKVPYELWCECLHKYEPYAVIVDAFDNDGFQDAFLCDLDGVLLDYSSDWSALDSAPAEVLETIEQGWASGNTIVERVERVSNCE